MVPCPTTLQLLIKNEDFDYYLIVVVRVGLKENMAESKRYHNWWNYMPVFIVKNHSQAVFCLEEKWSLCSILNCAIFHNFPK